MEAVGREERDSEGVLADTCIGKERKRPEERVDTYSITQRPGCGHMMKSCKKVVERYERMWGPPAVEKGERREGGEREIGPNRVYAKFCSL